MPPEILPLTSLKFLSVLNDVGRAPFASAGHEQGREEVECDTDDVLGEGLCRVPVREFQDKQGAEGRLQRGPARWASPFGAMRGMRTSRSVQRLLVS